MYIYTNIYMFSCVYNSTLYRKKISIYFMKNFEMEKFYDSKFQCKVVKNVAKQELIVKIVNKKN